MNMISGLEQPTTGEVFFDERAMSKVPIGERNVGFVFQNYAIFTHMSVYENLAFGLKSQPRSARRQERDRRARQGGRRDRRPVRPRSIARPRGSP